MQQPDLIVHDTDTAHVFSEQTEILNVITQMIVFQNFSMFDAEEESAYMVDLSNRNKICTPTGASLAFDDAVSCNASSDIDNGYIL